MRIVQFIVGSGLRRVGVVERNRVIDVTNPAKGLWSSLDLIAWADRERRDLAAAVHALGATGGRSYALAELDLPPSTASAYLDIPLDPPEVWGCGVTYRKSAEFRDEETDQPKGMYDYVYAAPRPEIFFKATAARCVGPNATIGIRSDSQFTAPEPELAIVVGSDGRILAYTVADDVSAWDIERENPLYLPQSKIFQGCCALGPSMVTPDEAGSPYELTVIGRIYRHGRVIFDDRAETSRIKRKLEELVTYLSRDNPIPAGTVICTGTGVIVSAEHALQEGDVVEIEVPGIGILRNPARRLGK
ncbi:MAG TPA: fumarylacetoacetate hydrolase family protein [Chloroflexota bacterium]|nr:fumarylacetoacetate hydrolase family protein [Chloroflexota bacterium]